MTRQEANKKLSNIFKMLSIGDESFRLQFNELINMYPDQRAGQIITNYICPDYRNLSCERTERIITSIFTCDLDPFYEESVDTLKRFQETCRYYEVEEILVLDIDMHIKQIVTDALGKLVYFDYNGRCKTATLAGLEQMGESLRYILWDSNGNELMLSTNFEITPLK